MVGNQVPYVNQLRRSTWCLIGLGIVIVAGSAAAHAETEGNVRITWSPKAIVETARITGIAIRQDGAVAYVVKRPSVDTGRTAYTLEVIFPGSKTPRVLIRRPFIGGIAAAPDGKGWTARMEESGGVQLYQIGDDGGARILIAVPDTVLVGGTGTYVASPVDPPRQVGVSGYGWAPNGRHIWYSRYLLKTPRQQADDYDNGFLFNDETMTGYGYVHSGAYLGKELRIFDTKTGDDKVVYLAPPTVTYDWQIFDTFWIPTQWSANSESLTFSILSYDSVGEPQRKTMRAWVNGRVQEIAQSETRARILSGISTWAGMLRSLRKGSEYHLMLSKDGTETDLGIVSFKYIYDVVQGSPGEDIVLSVRFPDRDGLYRYIPKTGMIGPLIRTTESLSQCASGPSGDFLVCVRESLARAPELVRIKVSEGNIEQIADPNASLQAELRTLRIETRRWKSRRGDDFNGYVIYPANYRPGRHYPTIIVTHGKSARNTFADQEFQWDFPVQALAEVGFLVLAVNESSSSEPMPSETWARLDRKFQKPIDEILDALDAEIARGLVDKDHVGIAGYSRGAQVADLFITRTNVARAAVIGEGGVPKAVTYLASFGSYRRGERHDFGGSPFDLQARAAWSEFSPSFRASRTSAALLMLEGEKRVLPARETLALLRDENIPAELVLYPDEAHLFQQPRHRASAMHRSLDWFRFWLQGYEDPHPAKADQYTRWRDMKAKWKQRRGTSTTHRSAAGNSKSTS